MGTRKCDAKPTDPPAADAQAGDVLVGRVQAWIAERDASDGLVRQWQTLEHQLSLRVKPLGMDLNQGVESNLSEARAMRGLMRRIRASDRRLAAEARRILRVRASSWEGALAKIQLGFRMQTPVGPEDVSYALMRDGFEELLARGAIRPASPGGPLRHSASPNATSPSRKATGGGNSPLSQ
jgi:hypothetical protein